MGPFGREVDVKTRFGQTKDEGRNTFFTFDERVMREKRVSVARMWGTILRDESRRHASFLVVDLIMPRRKWREIHAPHLENLTRTSWSLSH